MLSPQPNASYRTPAGSATTTTPQVRFQQAPQGQAPTWASVSGAPPPGVRQGRASAHGYPGNLSQRGAASANSYTQRPNVRTKTAPPAQPTRVSGQPPPPTVRASPKLVPRASPGPQAARQVRMSEAGPTVMMPEQQARVITTQKAVVNGASPAPAASPPTILRPAASAARPALTTPTSPHGRQAPTAPQRSAAQRRTVPAPSALAAAAAAEPKPEEVIMHITQLLRNRKVLKTHVIACFNQATAQSEATQAELVQLTEILSERIEVPLDAFKSLEVDFERFDFTGTGNLSVNQAYKLVKFHLIEYRKELGYHKITVENIPVRPLEAEGYEIVRDLGHGSYGLAKLATRRGEDYCLKCFSKAQMTATSVEDLVHEFEALSLLQCEFIAGARSMFQDSDNYYLVGDVYLGGDLTTLRTRAIGQGVDVSEEWWRNVFKQALEGIAFMHEQAMIHCDIKEPNIMVKTTDYSDPQIVIIDLGVAVCMAKDDDGNPHGTPGYVPPETLETLMWFPRGDLFSMGVTMLQMVTDKIPVDGPRDRFTPGGIFHEGCETVPEIFQATRTRPAPLHLLPEDWPLLSSLIESLLQKRRQDRPTAAMALKDAWFTFDSTNTGGMESWAPRAWTKLRPKGKLATVGITKSFMARVASEVPEENEEQGDAPDSDA